MTHRTFLVYFGLLIIMALFSCKVAERSNDTREERVKQLHTMPDGDFECKDNASGSHKLCMERKGKRPGVPSVKDDVTTLLVIEAVSGTVLLNEKIKGGRAIWENDRNIKIYYPAGIPDNETIKILNIDTGEKSEGSRH